jgi:hypothetical protein
MNATGFRLSSFFHEQNLLVHLLWPWLFFNNIGG